MGGPGTGVAVGAGIGAAVFGAEATSATAGAAGVPQDASSGSVITAMHGMSARHVFGRTTTPVWRVQPVEALPEGGLRDAAEVAVLLGCDAHLATVREDLRQTWRQRDAHVEQPVDDPWADTGRLEVADDLSG